MTTSPSSWSELLLARLGMPMPTDPVSAMGRKYIALSGKSPKPLPKNAAGVKVLNDSAPTRFEPLPPMSQSTPADRIVSCSLLW